MSTERGNGVGGGTTPGSIFAIAEAAAVTFRVSPERQSSKVYKFCLAGFENETTPLSTILNFCAPHPYTISPIPNTLNCNGVRYHHRAHNTTSQRTHPQNSNIRLPNNIQINPLCNSPPHQIIIQITGLGDSPFWIHRGTQIVVSDDGPAMRVCFPAGADTEFEWFGLAEREEGGGAVAAVGEDGEGLD